MALNAARAAEEAAGQIRWLRPEYQQKSEPAGQGTASATQPELSLPARKSRKRITAHRSPITSRLLPWPSSLPDQVRALRVALESAAGPVTPETLSARFKRAQPDRVAELLETLVIVGQARKLPDGRYTGKV